MVASGAFAACLLTAAASAEGAGAGAREEVRTILFGGFDAGSASFVSAGAKRTLGPTNRDGVLVMGGAGYGMRFERDGAAPGPRAPLVVRHTVLAHAVAGWQWVFDWGVVAAMAGPEMSHEQVGSRFAAQPGTRFGGRVHGEVWARPTEATLLTATLIAGSARGDVWGRLSWGWQVPVGYVGPEVAHYADLTGYGKTSLGLHLTGLEAWGLTFRLSAGLLREEPAHRTGGYLGLAAWTAL